MTVNNQSGKLVFIRESAKVEVAVPNGTTKQINDGRNGSFILISCGPMVIFQSVDAA